MFLIPLSLILIILLFVCPCLIPGNQPCVKKSFEPLMSRLTSMNNYVDQSDEDGYTVGKIAVINRKESVYSDNIKVYVPYDKDYIANRLHHIHFNTRLAKFRAAKPDQAHTLIFLHWSKELLGEISRRQLKTFIIVCEVVVVDQDKRIIVSRRFFKGKAPKKSKRLNTTESTGESKIKNNKKVKEIWGRAPKKAIVDFILSLPHREV